MHEADDFHQFTVEGVGVWVERGYGKVGMAYQCKINNENTNVPGDVYEFVIWKFTELLMQMLTHVYTQK
jgi:hypothetical protein